MSPFNARPVRQLVLQAAHAAVFGAIYVRQNQRQIQPQLLDVAHERLHFHTNGQPARKVHRPPGCSISKRVYQSVPIAGK